jgi:hypothetical protein
LLQFAEFIHARRSGATGAAQRTVAGSALACLLLGGCAGFEPPWYQPTTEPGPNVAAAPMAVPPAADFTEPEAQPLTDADRAEIRRLLQAARYATTDGLLIEPPESSALSYYDRVLLLDPENPEARYGIEGIVDRLILQARSAAEQRRFAAAEQILARALLVDPGHHGVRPALTEIRLLETARRDVFRLDPRALDARSAAVLSTLREAGQASRSPGCRAIIRARNDAEGRWIYQEMSAAPGRDRIRAELLIAGAPSIENVCFQGAE